MTSSGHRTWFITGCDKGLGLAIAEAALKQGDDVVATVLAKDGHSRIDGVYGDRFRSRHLDVTDHAASKRLVDEVEAELGGIDVLVNNAGFGLVGAAEETDAAEYRPLFEVNYFGMVELTRAALRGMRARKRGHILNISSLVGFVGAAGFTHYSASKFAVEGFSESLAEEVAPLGIKVTIIEPGGFRTDFAGQSLGRAREVIADYGPTSGNLRDYLKTRDGHQPGDPARLGAALCELVAMAQPPLRVALGDDAWQRVRQKIDRASAEAERWKALSHSTNFRS